MDYLIILLIGIAIGLVIAGLIIIQSAERLKKKDIEDHLIDNYGNNSKQCSK